MSRERPRVIELAEVRDESGRISIIEEGTHSPFAIKRVYFLHGLSPESQRGSHAHFQLRQVMVAASGEFRVRLTGAGWEETFLLDSPSQGLYVPPMTWRDLDSFSDGALCLVLASELYDEHDYIRDYQQFIELGRF